MIFLSDIFLGIAFHSYIVEIDSIDLKILNELEKDSRATLSTIGKSLNIKNNRIKNRIERMEEKGIIEGYTCICNPKSLGMKNLTMLRVSTKTLPDKQGKKNLLESLLKILIEQIPEIMFGSIGQRKKTQEYFLYLIIMSQNEKNQKEIFKKLNENQLIENIKETEIKMGPMASKFLTFKNGLEDKIKLDELDK